MKKLALSLAFVAAVSMTTTALIPTAKADNMFGNAYRWGTNASNTETAYSSRGDDVAKYIGTSWPFDSFHYTADFYGNISPSNTNNWYLQHFDAKMIQPMGCGDTWGLSHINVNGTLAYPVGDSAQSRTMGQEAYVNYSAWVPRNNSGNNVSFKLWHRMEACADNNYEVYQGIRYRIGF